MEAYLEGTCSGLPQATEALGLECAVWLGKVYKGVTKVMYLAVFLKPPRVGDVGTLRESTWECAARLGTLNSKIPSSLLLHRRTESEGRLCL